MIDTEGIEREVTDADIERWSKNAIGDNLFGPHIVNSLCVALRRERKQRADNPGVWDGVTGDAGLAQVWYFTKRGNDGKSLGKLEYTRTLPKTKARETAEKFAKEYDKECDDYVRRNMEDAIEQAIIEYEKTINHD